MNESEAKERVNVFVLWDKQWVSPHGTLDPNPMRIGDPDSKTTLPPHGLDPDQSCVLCCVTAPVRVCEFQSSSAMHVVCMQYAAHATPH